MRVGLLNYMLLKRIIENQNSSSKNFHSQIVVLFSENFYKKVINKGKTELTTGTHNLYTLLTTIFQE